MLQPRKKSTPDPPNDFAAATARWNRIDEEHRALLEKRKRLALALSFASAKAPTTADLERSAVARAFAGRDAIKLASRRPDKVVAEIADLDEAIQRSAANVRAERAIWEQACQEETARIAMGLQPRQRAAVQKIAKAIEAFSLAVAEAAEVQAELERTAPQPRSVYLPDVTSEFAAVVPPGDYGTFAAAWSRRMLHLGILP